MKPFEYYQTTHLTYPDKSQLTTVYAYKDGTVRWQGTLFEYRTLLSKDPQSISGCVTETVFDKEAFNKQLKEYNAELRTLEEEFKQDLFKHFKVDNNPKRDKCYSLAYEEAHAYGIESVYDKFEDFVELIKD